MEADWRAGAISPANIAAKYGIDRKTLISRMDGIPREAGPSLKRALVREAAAGIDVVDPQVGEKARELVAAAAQTDASAMTVAARASAAIIAAVEKQLTPDDPENTAKLRRQHPPRHPVYHRHIGNPWTHPGNNPLFDMIEWEKSRI